MRDFDFDFVVGSRVTTRPGRDLIGRSGAKLLSNSSAPSAALVALRGIAMFPPIRSFARNRDRWLYRKGGGGEPCVTSRWRRPTVDVSTRTVNAITHAIRRAEGFKRTSAHESRRAWPRDGSVTSAIYLGGDISPPHTHTPSPSAFTRRAEILSETRTRVRSLARAAKFVRLCGEGGEGDVFTSSRTRSPSIREGGGVSWQRDITWR